LVCGAVDKADEGWPFSTGFINEDMVKERLFPGEYILWRQQGTTLCGSSVVCSGGLDVCVCVANKQKILIWVKTVG
jgi:hypothetical protein